MHDQLDVQCPNCRTFFRPQVQSATRAVFCPRCGKNFATAADEGSTTGSNKAVLAIAVGGCLIGVLLLCVVVAGVGFWLVAAQPRNPAEVPVAAAPRSVEPPFASPPPVTLPRRKAENDSPSGQAAVGGPGQDIPPTQPEVPAPPPPPREPNPFDLPATPPTNATAPGQPAKPVPPTGQFPTAPPSNLTPPAGPPSGAVASTADGATRYGWKSGDVLTYNIATTAKLQGEQRETRGSASFTVRQADPRTALDGTPLERADREAATGSGFFVTRAGHLVSCAHVVRGATKVQVRWNGALHDAQVLALQHEHDLALLKIDATDVPVLELGDSDKVELAQEVRAVGYPLSDVLGSSVKITRGTVAGVVDRDERSLLQVDAAINAGNSGGPVVDERGCVVGVATSKLAGEDVSNVGFAVPAKVVKQWLTERRIDVAAPQDRDRLDGPELARRVTPAVVLLEVQVGPGGLGQERQFVFAFSGSVTTRNVAAPGPGPFGAPPFGPRGPFGMGGLGGGSDQGQLRVDAAGNVREFQGQEQLPFLIGPLGLVPFEPLPPAGTTKWRVRRPFTITITKNQDETIGGLPRALRPRAPFGPRGPMRPGAPLPPGFPFGPPGGNDTEKALAVLPAMETIDYEVTATTPREVTIRKRSDLKTLDKDEAKMSVALSLVGDYTVDRELGILVRLSQEGKFTEQSGDDTRTVPIKLTCERSAPSPPGAAPGGATTPAGPPAAAVPPPPPARPVLPDDEITQALVHAINPAADFATRHQALLKLGSAAPAEARRAEVVNGVLPVTTDKNFALSTAAIRAIGVWSGKEQIPTLLKLLDDTEGLARNNVYQALGECKLADPRLAKTLADRLLVREERSMAFQALRSQGAAAEDALLELLRQPDIDGQATFFVFIILREHGGEKSVAVLEELLKQQPDAARAGQINLCLSGIKSRLAKP